MWMPAKESKGEFAGSNGYCIWNEEHRIAQIVISRDSEDINHTVVHELLHLLIEGNMPQEKVMSQHRAWIEFAINNLSDVITKGRG
jgi:Zn-dependent peptidase ImmA (M78 family)